MEKQKLLDWLEDLKIKARDPMEGQRWYDTALQDVQDAINRGEFDKK